MVLNQHLRQSMNLAMDTGLASEMLSVDTDDARETGRAFAEKRSPKFKER